MNANISKARIARMSDKEYDAYAAKKQTEERQKMTDALIAAVALAPDVELQIALNWLQRRGFVPVDAKYWANYLQKKNRELDALFNFYAKYPYYAEKDGVNMKFVKEHQRMRAREAQRAKGATNAKPRKGGNRKT